MSTRAIVTYIYGLGCYCVIAFGDNGSTGILSATQQEKKIMNIELYRCKHCGQIVAIVNKTGVPVICCGEPMEQLVPCSTDASL